ncbi:MAG: PQQ-binding-like beta-propeller repeat protein [Verrucomicrobiota bacterium]
MSETNLGAPVYSTPVVVNGTIFVASNTHLYALGANAKPVNTDEALKVDLDLKKP